MSVKSGVRPAVRRCAHVAALVGSVVWVGALTGCALDPGQSVGIIRPSLPREIASPTAHTGKTKPAPIQTDETVAHVNYGPNSRPLIWERVRSGFSLPNGQEHEAVEDFVRFYQSKPRYLQQVTQRAEPFMHYIVEELSHRNMPMEIALLPAIESAFQADALSPSRAAGIWQFTDDTAKRYGLKRSWWYDGRRDVYESTQAALDYLQFLNVEFSGDWMLTLAAYNAGPGTVERAIEKNRVNGKPTDFWNLDLPTETQRYVPKLLALKALVTSAGQIGGVDLFPIPDEPYFAAIEIDTQCNLDSAAGIAGLPVVDFQALNPGFLRGRTDPDGPHRLLVPRAHAAEFKSRVSELATEDMLQARHHRVARGESWTHIASRYGVSVADIKENNPGERSKTRPTSGHVLLIPTRKEVVAIAEAPRTPSPVRSEDGQVVHTVAAGETFWSIARSYGVPVKMLAKWNRKNASHRLQIGDRLVVFRSSPQLARRSES